MRRLLLMAAVFAVALLASCPSSMRGFVRMDEMSDAEFASYSSRTELQVSAVARTAIAEGELSPEAALKVADALDGFAKGTTAPAAGMLAEELDLEGWGALALTLAVVELDAGLEELGAYGPGWERAQGVLRAVAEGIREAAEGDQG